ncbi:hypothetical protein ccbrp13_56350 [Ktedonobacteria bacterium brp13]|nr:hypothetical protein ccbrp13_56350 [Ktedonobacteria bacterium brp13]
MWYKIAADVTHTSVAATKLIIGRSEFIDWIAYFKIKKEEAIKEAKKK